MAHHQRHVSADETIQPAQQADTGIPPRHPGQIGQAPAQLPLIKPGSGRLALASVPVDRTTASPIIAPASDPVEPVALSEDGLSETTADFMDNEIFEMPAVNEHLPASVLLSGVPIVHITEVQRCVLS